MVKSYSVHCVEMWEGSFKFITCNSMIFLELFMNSKFRDHNRGNAPELLRISGVSCLVFVDVLTLLECCVELFGSL